MANIVVYDPGHGGPDPGTVAAGESWPEKLINLKISKRVYEDTQNEFDARLTWAVDWDGGKLSLDTRLAIAKNARALLFLSNHCNASTNDAAHGLQVYYYNRDSRGVAERLYESIVDAALDSGYDLRSKWSGVKEGVYYVLRENPCPLAVLIEHGFLSNGLDRDWLCSPIGQLSHAHGVARALLEGGF